VESERHLGALAWVLLVVRLDSLDRAIKALASVQSERSRARATGSTAWALQAACRRRCQATKALQIDFEVLRVLRGGHEGSGGAWS